MSIILETNGPPGRGQHLPATGDVRRELTSPRGPLQAEQKGSQAPVRRRAINAPAMTATAIANFVARMWYGGSSEPLRGSYAAVMDASAVVWTGLPGYILDAGSTHDVIAQVIDVCEAQRPHEDWERLRALGWDDGAERVAQWLQELLRDKPPGPEVRGLWFGLNNPIDANGQTRADLYVSGTSEYDPDDEQLEWVFSGIYHPKRQPAPDCLTEMYRIAYHEDDGLDNDAEWPLALVFGCVAVARALQALDLPSTGWRPAAPAGAVCGFDGGDFIFVGELDAEGFRAAPRVF